MIGIDHIIVEVEGFQGAGVQRQRLVTGKADSSGAMFAVSTGVGQGIQIHNANLAFLGGTQFQCDLHLVTGRAGDLGFLAGVNDPCRTTGLHRDKSGVYITDCGLLGTEAATDSRLFHTDLALGNAQSPG